AIGANMQLLQCHMTDPESGEDQHCAGQYCTYWKYDDVMKDGDSVQVVVQGCYNWTSTAVKRLGCYRAIDQPKQNIKNGVVCICQQDFCNTEQLMNLNPPQTAKLYNCQDSISHSTCSGFACVTVKL